MVKTTEKEIATKLRREENLSINEIAEKLQISKSTSFRWVGNIPLDKISRIKSKKEHKYTCEICKNDFSQRKKRDYRRKIIKCKNCRRKRIHHANLNDVTSIMSFSTRTISKILKRAGIKCSMCKWNQTTLDTHHIIEKSKGGTDEHDNLISLCPNCHRKAHEKQFTKEELREKSLDKTFKNWKDHYNPPTGGNAFVQN